MLRLCALILTHLVTHYTWWKSFCVVLSAFWNAMYLRNNAVVSGYLLGKVVGLTLPRFSAGAVAQGCLGESFRVQPCPVLCFFGLWSCGDVLPAGAEAGVRGGKLFGPDLRQSGRSCMEFDTTVFGAERRLGEEATTTLKTETDNRHTLHKIPTCERSKP